MSPTKHRWRDLTCWGMSVDEIVHHCSSVPSNWDVFQRRLEKDWETERDPAAPAKSILTANRLGHLPPAWSGKWLEKTLLAALAGKSLDVASGFRAGRRGRGGSVEERRKVRRGREYAGMGMYVLIRRDGWKEAAAAKYMEKMLLSQFDYSLKAASIERMWRKGTLPVPEDVKEFGIKEGF